MLTIRPLNTGWIPAAPEQYFFFTPALPYRNVPRGRVDLPAFAFLIEGGPEPLLIDTGMPDAGHANRTHSHSHPGVRRDPGTDLVSQLNRAGYSAEDIGAVIFTHLHWDHIGGLSALRKAKLYAHPKECAFARDPIPPYYRAYEHPAAGGNAPFAGRDFLPAEEGWGPFTGVRVIETPGHSPGHLSVEVETEAGRYLCVGDALFLRENLDPTPELSYGVTPPGKYCSIIDSWRSVERIAARQDRERLLISHDRALWRRAERTPVFGKKEMEGEP